MARSVTVFVPVALALIGCGSELNLGTSKPACNDCEGGAAPIPTTGPNAEGGGPVPGSPGAPGGGAAPNGILPAGPWKEVANGMAGGLITSVAYDPGNAKIVYAASRGAGVFKSTDGAATWTPSSLGLGEQLCVEGVYVHPAVPATVFATAEPCGGAAGARKGSFDLFRSTNAGATWTKVTPPDRLDPRLEVPVLASLADASVVYAYSNDQLWRSSDGGATWKPRNVLPSTRHIVGAVVDPTQADVLFATFDIGNVPHRTVRSADGGVTWTDVNLPAGRFAGRLWVAPDRTLWATMIASGSSELWSSANDGATWGMRSGPRPCIAGDVAFAPSASRVYAVGFDSVCTSNALGPFEPTTTLPGLETSNIAVSPANADELLVGTTTGLLRSSDAGASVAETQAGITNRDVFSLTIAPSDGHVLYAGAHDAVFKSGDGAKTWKRVGAGLPKEFYVTALAVHPSNASIVYAGVDEHEGNLIRHCLYKSVDGGVTFQKLEQLGNITAIAVDPTNPAHVSAVIEGDSVMTSTNDGMTWTPSLSLGAAATGHIVTHPTEPAIVGLVRRPRYDWGTDLPSFRSHDGGLTFAEWTLPPKTVDVAFDAQAPAKLYACTKEGPKVSIDNGLSWSPALVGLVSQDASPIECRRFFQTRKGGQLYMNDQQGAFWVTKDGAVTWTRTKGIATLPGGPALATFHQHRITSAVVDGDSPDTVYIGLRSSVGVVKTTTAGL